MALLEIRDLHVSVAGKEILRGLDLVLESGEVHAIMGPNGSGKSTLAHVLAGREGYQVTRGSVAYLGEDLLALEPEERAVRGVFLAFQYPVEIPGVTNSYFMKVATNAVRRTRGQPELDAIDFLTLVKEKMKGLEMDEKFLSRSVNEGFSGGEKKRNEILQHRLLEYLEPDRVHVLMAGRIERSGGHELALELEERGYAWIEQELGKR